jgi:hypothetical protein
VQNQSHNVGKKHIFESVIVSFSIFSHERPYCFRIESFEKLVLLRLKAVRRVFPL